MPSAHGLESWSGHYSVRRGECNIMLFSDSTEGFVSIGDAVPDVLLDIRYYGTFNFIGDRIDGYEQAAALITRQAAQALRAVSDEMAGQGFRLKIFDAYRPQQAVNHFMRWMQDADDTRMKKYFYPEIEKTDMVSCGAFRPQPRQHGGPDAF